MIARNVIDIYSVVANTRLLDYRVNMSYYRKFEETHKELLNELLKLKKMEKEEKKGVTEEAYMKVKMLAKKYGEQINRPSIETKKEVKKEEPANPVDIVKNIFSRILKN